MKKALAEKRNALTVLNGQADLNGAGVYVVGFHNYIKIGISSRLWERLIGLQEALPDQMVIHATMIGGRKLESELHGRFCQYRTRGEWFRNEGALKLWIEASCKLPFLHIVLAPEEVTSTKPSVTTLSE